MSEGIDMSKFAAKDVSAANILETILETKKSPISIEEGLALARKLSRGRFDESVDLAIVLGLDSRKSEQVVRGYVDLPKGIGRKVKLAFFATGKIAEEGKKAGADIVGGAELVSKIEKEGVFFDRSLAIPDMMPLLGRIGKILGPRGLMPNPRLGTVVSEDIASKVKSLKGGQVNFRSDRFGIVHLSIGRLSFKTEDLALNMATVLEAINRLRPVGVKSKYIKRIFINSTQGAAIGVRVN